MLGFDKLGAFGHKAEDVLALVRNKIIVIDKPVIDVLLHTIDMMILILGDIRAEAGDGRDTTNEIAALENILIAAQSKKIPPETPAGQKSRSEKPQAAKAVAVEPGVASPAVAPAKSTAKGGIVFDMSDTPPAASQASPPGSKLKILIVEDDFTARSMLTHFLSEFGICHIAKDGLEAIQAFTHSYESNPPHPYDLICMDVMMPNIDGDVAAKTIREIERSKGVAGPEFESAIVFISAVTDPVRIIKVCYECGANYYFVKPLDFNQIKRQLKKLNLIN